MTTFTARPSRPINSTRWRTGGALLVLAMLATAHGASAQTVDWVWNSNPFAVGTYTPDTSYSFNSANTFANYNTITHNGTGSYTVHFLFAGSGRAAGNVEIGGYGGANVCSSTGWGPSGSSNVDVGVLCQDLSGNNVDSGFTALYQERGFTIGRAKFGYVWAGLPTTDSYVAPVNYSFNSAGGTNTIMRNAQGIYTVLLPQLAGLDGPGAKGEAGSVLVTGFGGGTLCVTNSTLSLITDELIGVTCKSLTTNKYVDSIFNLSYSFGAPMGSGGDVAAGTSAMLGAYVKNTKPTASGSYVPQSAVSKSTIGTGKPQITHSGTGQYAVSLPGASPYRTSMAMVTINGSPSTVPGGNHQTCNVRNWNPTSSTIYVDCYDGFGALEDHEFDLTYDVSN